LDINIKLMTVMTRFSNTLLKRLGENLESKGMLSSVYAMLSHLNVVDRAKTQKLGEVAVITSGTTTHIVKKMIQQGYVIKVQDKDDKRVFWIEITNEGRKAFLDVHTEHMAYLDDLLKPFSDSEKEAFIEIVKHFGLTIEENIDLNK